MGPRDAVLVAIEDDPGVVIRPRLDAAGADAGRVHYLRSIQGTDGRERSICDLVPHLPDIESKIVATNAALVIFDPVGGLLGGRDANAMHEVREGLDLLVDLARRTSAAVVVIHHLNKGGNAGGPAIHRLSGSTGFSAVPRAIWAVVRDPDDDDRRIMVPTKSNLAPTREALPFIIRKVDGCLAPNITWGEAFEVGDVDELVTPTRRRSGDGDAGGERGPGPAVAEAGDFLRAVLTGRSRPAAEVFEMGDHQGISKRSVERASTLAGVRKEKVGDRWMWSLT